MKLNLSRARFPRSFSPGASLASSSTVLVNRASALAINKLVEKVRERERERIDTRWHTEDTCTLRLRILSIERTSTTAYHASVCHVLSNFICEATKNLASRRRRYVGTDKEKKATKSKPRRLSGFANDVRLAEFFLAYGIIRVMDDKEVRSRPNA